MFKGRPEKKVRAEIVRELKPGELDAPRGRETPVAKLRDVHHRMAQLFAAGLGTGDVAEITGYSLSRVSVLRASPAMEELISTIRGQDNLVIRDRAAETFENMAGVVSLAMREIRDRIEEAPGEVPLGTLQKLVSDLGDRVGFVKRTVNVNVNMDFAARLEKARTAVKVIEAQRDREIDH